MTTKPRYRGTLSGDGRPGPIEARIGRRLLRLIDPDSAEGLRLLDEARVVLLGPDGERLGTLKPDEALARLRERLERQLEEVSSSTDRYAIQNGIDRLRQRSARLAPGREGH